VSASRNGRLLRRERSLDTRRTALDGKRNAR